MHSKDKSRSESLHILLVDDEARICRLLQLCLEEEGHKIDCASTSAQAMAKAAEKSFDVVMLDIRLGNESGIDLIAPFSRQFPWMRIVMITAHATVETAIQAMRLGAADYLPKPFSPEEVIHTVARVRKMAALESKVAELTAVGFAAGKAPSLDSTSCGRMRKVLDLASDIAATDATVLIRGESGTGKTIMARWIHNASHRAAHPFVLVSCPSLSSELLESELFGHVKGSFTGAHRDYAGRVASAQRGTLFLDEIGDMSPALQAKMLRFVQDREYESVGDSATRRADVRIITATNADLEEAVRDGRFREDLLFRLNVIELDMESLSNRSADILPIANGLVRQLATEFARPARGFSAEAEQALLAYRWPGNIRELRNVIERCVLLTKGDTISVEHMPNRVTEGSIPAAVTESAQPDGRLLTLDELEEAHIRRVLVASQSIEEAATILGIDQTTLYRRRKRYGLL